MSTETVVGLLGGFGLGLLASYLVWIWTATFYIPKLALSQITRESAGDGAGGVRYRIKLLNGRRTAAADLSFECRVVLQGLNPGHPTNWTSIRIPVGDEHPFPVIEGRSTRIYTLHIEDASGHGLDRLAAKDRARLQSGAMRLEELLGLSKGAPYIRLAVSGSHEKGGLRRTEHRVYHATDIVPGSFRSNKTLDIDAETDGHE